MAYFPTWSTTAAPVPDENNEASDSSAHTRMTVRRARDSEYWT